MTKHMLSLVALGMLLLSGGLAYADQCAWIKPEEAQKALQFLPAGTDFLHYCEPCGDTDPVPDKVTRAEIGVPDGGAGYLEVRINGKPEDIAYIFVKKPQARQYSNLAKLAGCRCTDVSKSITYPLAKSTTSRFAPWCGRYQLSENAGLTLKESTLHTGWLETTFFLISPEWGDQRGELTGFLHMDEEPPIFITPFAGCALLLDRDQNAVNVRDNGKCGGVFRNVVGSYAKTTDIH